MRQLENGQKAKRPPLSNWKVQPILWDSQNDPKPKPPELTDLEKAQREFFEWFDSKEQVHDVLDTVFTCVHLTNCREPYTADYMFKILHLQNYLQKFIRIMNPTPHLTKENLH